VWVALLSSPGHSSDNGYDLPFPRVEQRAPSFSYIPFGERIDKVIASFFLAEAWIAGRTGLFFSISLVPSAASVDGEPVRFLLLREHKPRRFQPPLSENPKLVGLSFSVPLPPFSPSKKSGYCGLHQ